MAAVVLVDDGVAPAPGDQEAVHRDRHHERVAYPEGVFPRNRYVSMTCRDVKTETLDAS
jgi:hypothetical protein